MPADRGPDGDADKEPGRTGSGHGDGYPHKARPFDPFAGADSSARNPLKRGSGTGAEPEKAPRPKGRFGDVKRVPKREAAPPPPPAPAGEPDELDEVLAEAPPVPTPRPTAPPSSLPLPSPPAATGPAVSAAAPALPSPRPSSEAPPRQAVERLAPPQAPGARTSLTTELDHDLDVERDDDLKDLDDLDDLDDRTFGLSGAGDDTQFKAPKVGARRARRNAKRQHKRKSRNRAITEWIVVIVGALLIALIVQRFVFQAFYIPSESMYPTLQEGDRVMVNKLSYDAHDVNRGDVVVFDRPSDQCGDQEIKDLIKRVIALPGESIESTPEGRILIDGRLLEEPYLPDGAQLGPAIEPQVIPEGHVFVMGDNRTASCDSRRFDAIPIDSIVGRAFVIIWPIGDAGGL